MVTGPAMAMAATGAATVTDRRDRFRRVLGDVDVAPFVAELNAAEPLWSLDTSRQNRIPAHRNTETIFLRRADPLSAEESVRDIQESRFTKEARHFPRLVRFIRGFAAGLGGDLGRLLLIRLRPGARVEAHVDEGEYYAWRQRYHLVLVSPGGSPMVCAGRRAILRAGELWWFDNKAPHSATNPSPDHWRVHAVFDIRTPRVAPEDAVHDAAARTNRAVPLQLPSIGQPFRILRQRLGLRSDQRDRARLRGLLSDAVVRAPDLQKARQSDDQASGPANMHTTAPLLTSPTGRPLSWLVDALPVLLAGEGAVLAARCFWHRFPDLEDPAQIAGPVAGAVPLITGIAAEGWRTGRTVNGLLIRRDRSPHGLRRQVEGRVLGSDAILVDDLLNSGQALERSRAALLAEGIQCDRAFVLVDFQSPRGLQWRRETGLEVEALFQPTDLGVTIG